MTAPKESLAMWVALGRGIDNNIADISCLVLDQKGSKEQPAMATPAALWISGISAIEVKISSLGWMSSAALPLNQAPKPPLGNAEPFPWRAPSVKVSGHQELAQRKVPLPA